MKTLLRWTFLLFFVPIACSPLDDSPLRPSVGEETETEEETYRIAYVAENGAAEYKNSEWTAENTLRMYDSAGNTTMTITYDEQGRVSRFRSPNSDFDYRYRHEGDGTSNSVSMYNRRYISVDGSAEYKDSEWTAENTMISIAYTGNTAMTRTFDEQGRVSRFQI